MLRLDPLTARTEIVARWDSRSPSDRFSLASGPNATLYLAASQGERSHAVGAITRDGRVRGVVRGEGGLTEAPSHASARGLTVVVTSHTGPRALGYEWSRFTRERGRAAEAWP